MRNFAFAFKRLAGVQSGERIGGNQDWKQKTRWKADAVLLGRDNDDYAKGVAVWIGRSSEN